MSDFKVGDKVRVLEMAIGGDILVGTVDVITDVRGNGVVLVGKSSCNYFLGGHGGKLELVNPEPVCHNAPHMHHKEIIAWAEGAQIQWFGLYSQKWNDSDGTPVWSTDVKYRVKPAVNPRLEALNDKLAELNKEISEIKKQIKELNK